MPEERVQFRRAELADIAALLRLQADYYAEDGYIHDEGKARRAWEIFLSDTSLGRAWAVDSATGLVGYVVVALGYSLEYHGFDAFVDELYLVPAARGQGLGRKALRVAETACAELGVNALHLEVEPGKTGAQELYRRMGFVGSQRTLNDEAAETARGVATGCQRKPLKHPRASRLRLQVGRFPPRQEANCPRCRPRRGCRIEEDRLIGHDQIPARARQHAGRLARSSADNFCE